MSEEALDPNQISSTYVHTISEAKALREMIPFSKVRQLSVVISIEEDLKADCFIYDIVSVAQDVGKNLQRFIAGPCTIIHAFSHNSSSVENYIHRQDMISDCKIKQKESLKKQSCV